MTLNSSQRVIESMTSAVCERHAVVSSKITVCYFLTMMLGHQFCGCLFWRSVMITDRLGHCLNLYLLLICRHKANSIKGCTLPKMVESSRFIQNNQKRKNKHNALKKRNIHLLATRGGVLYDL